MTTRKELDKISADYERKMLQTFTAIISDIRDQAFIAEIVRALETGNVDRVIFLLQLNETAWEPMEELIRETYRAGGIATVAQIGAIQTAEGVIRSSFSMRSPASERWLAEQSSRLVTEVVEPQKQAIRDYLGAGLARGDNPRTMALDIVGRINPATRKREGGIVGLTSQQAQWVANARDELKNLDPNYLTRKLRDKRFDSSVKKAIADGKPLPVKLIDNAINRMQAITEKKRGNDIARTESITALRAGQFESINQAVDTGEVDRNDVVKEWDDSGNDGRTRDTHRRADGQVVPVDQPFIVGGDRLMYPGDPRGSAKETINCRCSMRTRIDFAGQLKRIEGFR